MNKALLDIVGGEFSSSTAIDRSDGGVIRPCSSNAMVDAAAAPSTARQPQPQPQTETQPDPQPPQSPPLILGPQHFELLKLVGEGAFGKVILVRNRLDKNLYAMKAISKKLLRKKNNMQYMKSERDILTKVHHPFIVTLWFAFQTEQRLFLVMDFLSGGELFFHLKRKGLILEPEARLYLAEMILAIEFLHSMGVVHRDLKPENVLLRPDGHICLTDFGLAKEVGDDNSQVRTLCGTSEYMAPEMLLRKGYTKAVDWWALGALFFEILAGRPPFQAKTAKELDKKILSEKCSIPSYVTADAASLVKGLLEKDVNKRLGAVKTNMFSIGGVAGLKAHVFFQDLDWHAVLACKYDPPIRPFEHQAPEGGVSSDSAVADSSAPLASPSVANFHEGFTGQCLSPSVIEETFGFNASPSPAMSPAISRSHSLDSCLDADDSAIEYPDFEFVEPSFTCTADQLLAFDEELTHRQQRSAKKKEHKAKLQEGKARRASDLADAQALVAASEALRRAEQQAAQDLRAARDRALRERDEEIKRLEARVKARHDWTEMYVALYFPPPPRPPANLSSHPTHSPHSLTHTGSTSCRKRFETPRKRPRTFRNSNNGSRGALRLRRSRRSNGSNCVASPKSRQRLRLPRQSSPRPPLRNLWTEARRMLPRLQSCILQSRQSRSLLKRKPRLLSNQSQQR